LGGQYDALNDRESELLLMISTGMMNSQIAEETGLTLGTVKWYLQQIYAKLGVNRRSEATFKARQLGLIR
jgi:DNA-binding NarL/FixJ family response regulator